MEERKVKVGDSIVVMPAKNAEDLRHNHSIEVPGIVTATFGSPKLCNARVFQDGYHVPAWLTSTQHQSTAGAGATCWRYADEVVQLPEGDERAEDFAPAATTNQDTSADNAGNGEAAANG